MIFAYHLIPGIRTLNANRQRHQSPHKSTVWQNDKVPAGWDGWSPVFQPLPRATGTSTPLRRTDCAETGALHPGLGLQQLRPCSSFSVCKPPHLLWFHMVSIPKNVEYVWPFGTAQVLELHGAVSNVVGNLVKMPNCVTFMYVFSQSWPKTWVPSLLQSCATKNATPALPSPTFGGSRSAALVIPPTFSLNSGGLCFSFSVG